MSLVQFTIDARPYRGYEKVYINPNEVSSVSGSHSGGNPTKIIMQNGTFYHVMGWPDDAAAKLMGEEKP